MNNNYKKNLSVVFDQAKRPNKPSGVSHEQEKMGPGFSSNFKRQLAGRNFIFVFQLF